MSTEIDYMKSAVLSKPVKALVTSVVFDDFERADGPIGTAPTGQTWTAQLAGATISSGKMVSTANNNAVTASTALTNATVAAKVTGKNVGPLVCGVDTLGTGYWVVSIGTGYRMLKKPAGGSASIIGSTSGITPLTDAEVRIQATATHVIAYENGVKVLEIADATIRGSYHGALFSIAADGQIGEIAVFA